MEPGLLCLSYFSSKNHSHSARCSMPALLPFRPSFSAKMWTTDLLGLIEPGYPSPKRRVSQYVEGAPKIKFIHKPKLNLLFHSANQCKKFDYFTGKNSLCVAQGAYIAPQFTPSSGNQTS